MRFLKQLCLLILVVVCGFVLAWFARGEWDKAFFMEGQFHVVNQTENEIDVVLDFPSGEKVNLEIGGLGSSDFRMRDTGEGSVQVSVDNQVVYSVGYVTSMNGIVVLSIGDSGVNFSQIYPGFESD